MSLTGRSPVRRASTMRRRMGSARISKTSTCMMTYIHQHAYVSRGRLLSRSLDRVTTAGDRVAHPAEDGCERGHISIANCDGGVPADDIDEQRWAQGDPVIPPRMTRVDSQQ